MPTDFTRPTRAQILARVRADIEGELAGVSARPRRRPEAAHARAIMGVSDVAHGHIAWAAEQILPDQAVERYLLRWASLFGLSRRAAERASGSVICTGTGTVPAETQLVRVQDGLAFRVTTETAVAGSTPVPITAVLGGKAGNLDDGETLQFGSTVPGVDSVATVAGDLEGGTELESLEELLDRLLDRIQKPPLGGAPGDHVAWAKQLAIVDRAWEYGGKDGDDNPGPGKIAVTFVLEGDGPDIIPSEEQVALVQEYLDMRSPAEVIVFAPEDLPLELAIDLGENDDEDGDIREAVRLQLKEMLRNDAEPGGTIYLSRISEAISAATGEVSHTLVSPGSNQTAGFGQIYVYADPNFDP